MVCQPPAEDLWSKFGPTMPSLFLSVVAIVVSVLTYRYNRSKDQRAREQSIRDDFWLRKVVSPLSIEPFLKFAQELPRALPVASGTSDDAVETFWTTQVAKVGDFEVAFRALGLIDVALGEAVASKLEAFEDLLATYCGDLRAHLKDSATPAPNATAAGHALLTTTLELLKLIQLQQTSVGRASNRGWLRTWWDAHSLFRTGS